MKSCTFEMIGIVVVLFGPLGASFVTECWAETCITNPGPGSGPDICVDWGEAGDPVLGVHFSLDFQTDEDFPNIELEAGSLTWQIWSVDTDNPDDIGDIGFITSPHPEDFGVKVEDDLGNAGAREVKGIILDPTDPSNSSSLTGGRITGNLSGDLLLQKSAGGSGGDIVSFQIDGDSTGIVTIPTVTSLSIGGDVTGGMNIGETTGLGFLSVAAVTGNMEIGVSRGPFSLGNVSAQILVTDRIEGGRLNVAGTPSVAAGECHL